MAAFHDVEHKIMDTRSLQFITLPQNGNNVIKKISIGVSIKSVIQLVNYTQMSILGYA
jgi:hypothetical protein